MNSINIQLIILIITFMRQNECNEIEIIKNKLNKLKEDFKYVAQSMSTQIAEFKEEVKKGYFYYLLYTENSSFANQVII
jgi:hypothetical protein